MLRPDRIIVDQDPFTGVSRVERFLVAAWAHLLALGGRVHQDLLVGAGHGGDVPGLGAGRGQAEAAVLPPPRLQVPHHPPVADAEVEAGEARAQPEYHQQRT